MDTTPILTRLNAIAESVSALGELQSLSYDEFVSDRRLISSAERDFQVAIQAAIDVAGILLANLSVGIAIGYADAFRKLGDLGLVPRDFAERLASMAGFRNVLVHMYLQVDPTKVYHALQHDLSDLDTFITYVGQYLTDRETGGAG